LWEFLLSASVLRYEPGVTAGFAFTKMTGFTGLTGLAGTVAFSCGAGSFEGDF
jgi:hypothetical protein